MALIAWYPLNGDTLDYSGNGYNLTNSGAVIDTNGKIGSCYSFGDNRYLLSDTIDIKGDISMCLWFKPTGTPLATTWGGILSNHHHPSPPSNFTLNYNVNGSVYVHAGFTDGTRSEGISSPGNLVNSDVWSHIVFTYDIKTNTGSIYVNGVRVTKSPFPKQPKITPYNFILGQWAPTYLNNYEVVGNINDVRIYDHVLSEKEVKDLSKAMVLHYKFDDFQEPTQNLTANGGDFENGLMTNFHAYNNASGAGATVTLSVVDPVVEGIPKSPNKSDKVLKITVNNTVNSTQNTGWFNSQTFLANKTYTQSVYMYFPTSVSPYGWANNGGITNINLVNPLPKAEWQKYERTFTVGASNYSGGLHYYANSPGNSYSFYVDMHQLEEKPYSTEFTTGDRPGLINDSSGYNNHNILNLTTTPKWVTNSKIGGGAYELDRTLKYISLTDNFSPSILENCTISFWRKQTSSGNWMFANDGTKYIMATASGTGNFYHGSITGTPQIFVDGVLRAAPINDTNWHHYVIRNLNISTWSKIRVTDYSSWYFAGIVDDIRIYNTSLSDEDVKELYNTRTSLTSNAKLIVNTQLVETKHKPLILDYTTWQDGQTGSIGQFSQNGSNHENFRVLGNDPWGKETVIWEARGSGENANDGGWNSSSFAIDNTKLYRYSVWVKRSVIGTGSFYLGCAGNQVNNLSGTINNNPYFHSSGINHNDWRLYVGHIHPHDYSLTTHHPDSGIYSIDGKIGNIQNDFKAVSTSTTNIHRSYLYYTTTSNTRQQWVYPRVDLCDGTEPSIQDLLNGFDSRNIDYVRQKGGTKPITMDVGDKQTFVGEINEIGFPIRYIRESMVGSSSNTGNHWVEIQAYDKTGTNIALGKTAVSTILTDGNTASATYYSSGPATVDLGGIYNISYLKIWHYWADGRTYYNIKTEVSEDNVNWVTVFDSEIDGRYPETSAGKTIYLKPQKFTLDSKGNVFTNELKEI